MDADDRVRVSDAERETIVNRLNEATGEGRLTLAEFGERAGQVYEAKTRGELARLVDDLPATHGSPSGLARPLTPATDREIAVERVPLGSVKRGGNWRLERDTALGTVVGSVKLNLRQAEVAAPEVTLIVKTVVGSVKVWIPRGVRVEVSGTTVVGSRRVDEDAADYPNAPLLRLRIDTVVGSVKVYRVGGR